MSLLFAFEGLPKEKFGSQSSLSRFLEGILLHVRIKCRGEQQSPTSMTSRLAYHTDTCAAKFHAAEVGDETGVSNASKDEAAGSDGTGDPGERVNRWASEDPSVSWVPNQM